MTKDDLISRQAAITIPILPVEHRKYQTMNLDDAYELGWRDCQKYIEDLPSAQPETHEERTETHSCDCIERQAAIDAVGSMLRRKFGIGGDLAEIMLAGLPSAQAEIVRCKECKYWMPHSQLGYDEDNETYHDYCERLIPDDEYYAFYRDADDYCSRAERRSDG